VNESPKGFGQNVTLKIENMDYTVVGFFDDKSEADKASRKLRNDGFEDNQVDVSPYRTEGDYQEGDYHYEEEENTSGFWNWLFGDDDDDENRKRHSRVGARTNIVTVQSADRAQAEKAASIMDDCGALDVDDYDKTLQGDRNMGTMDDSGQRLQEDRDLDIKGEHDTTEHSDGSIEVMKEDISVGKREVDTGGVRIKSRIVEKPVEETVRLREERVYVTRKPVDRAVDNSEGFEDKTISMDEHSEEAVVEKNTRVVEEISIDKDVEEHDETISETVRETKIDVQKDAERDSDNFEKSKRKRMNEDRV